MYSKKQTRKASSRGKRETLTRRMARTVKYGQLVRATFAAPAR